MKIQIAGLTFDSIVDGPGLRNTLFVQGCTHGCLGCHNPETWSKTGGKSSTTEKIIHQFLSSSNQSVTFSGGEPFQQAKACGQIAATLRENDFNLWAYSGYLYEQLFKDSDQFYFLQQLDVLVDGPFVLSKRSLALNYKGSSNQRVIDVQKSLVEGRVVLFTLEKKPEHKKHKLYI